jgi:hypothetical protein
MGEKKNAYRLLVGKPERRRQLGIQLGGWIILGWILEWWDGVMWTGLVLNGWSGLVNSVLNLLVP